MTREDNPYLNKTYVYTYDNAGNRTSKKTYAYTTGTLGTVISRENYEYDGDRLTRVGSMQYTYDTIGNPTYYNGYKMEWEGRQLTKMSMNGGQFGYEFEYNADGIRTMKSSLGGTAHVYGLNGSQIQTETIGNKLLVYLYDESGSPIGLQYRTTSYAANRFDTYYFEKNLQGDIIAVYTEGGTKIGSYTYDAWGVCSYSYASGATSAQKQIVSTLNPFRYRGYYYDTETGFYYLQTRYYNPQWGRFLNADGYVSTGTGLIGYNMYAYCNNNPVSLVDPTGEFPWIVIAIVVVTISVFLSGCSSEPSNTPPSDYIQEDSTQQNCYSYAFGLPFSANPGDYSVSDKDKTCLSDKSINTPEEIRDFVLRDMKRFPMSVRVVENISDKENDEYIVAMKTSDQPVPGQNYADYHFARLLSDGTWADKPGSLKSRWNKIDGTAATWDLGNIAGYYNSETIYFAVKVKGK